MMRRAVLVVSVVGVLLGAGIAGAQPPLSNGRLESRAVSGSLDADFAALAASLVEPAWVGYAVPLIEGDHQMCCFERGADCCGGCRLEPGEAGVFAGRQGSGVARLEAGRMLHVLFRVERGEVNRLRMFSDACALDAGGRSLHWLTGVTGAQSLGLLASFTAGTSARRIGDGALAAIAMHAEPAAVDRLLTTAGTGATTHLRGQALFWLAQRASERAVGAIADAVERDPDTEVKRRAVFALSQLPPDEGVPRLIDVARSHSNRAVRRQAMFWLGQSKDPRALAFFAEILE